ncbi:MAG: aspartate-semialdehyde dehydrogenase [Clostridia bacterium]|nr:aspartate-semialdehyde dehydrogenase [Clostridia bacterium]MDD4386918.1 aspartate-semialdehyde dehydrogenase [Clostridia bacterium]
MIKCAIVGATGLVGQTILKVLEEKKLRIDEYELFASSRSVGNKIKFMDKEYTVQELTEESFKKTKFNYALFSAGEIISEKYIPLAVKSGCIVVDNSSYFRMYDDVPLVVPEVNEYEIFKHNGIIANPNCSTIQAILPLKALNDEYTISRIIYSTYQAVSGAGNDGISDLVNTRNGSGPNKFPYNITDNCIPQVDIFLENNYTKEEIKMIEETRKILKNPKLPITATCVRIPVLNCHSESINIEFENEFNIQDILKVLSNYPGITVIDEIDNNIYPINELANGIDDILVGRIRRDYSVKNGINLWVVADNVRKGAASNSVQILEKLIEKRHDI